MELRKVEELGYDEAILVESDGEELTTPGGSEADADVDEDEDASPPAPTKALSPIGAREPPKAPILQALGSSKVVVEDEPQEDHQEGDGSEESSASSNSTSSSSSGDEEGDESEEKEKLPPGAYDPERHKKLATTPELEEIFQLITRYKPHTISLDTILKPFIPEFVPSIGEVDAFLKMPRPDGKPCMLGMVQLDEPTLNPSDPAILDLQLRSLCKTQDLEPMDVRSIEHAEKCPSEIENWIKRVEDLNRSKPAPSVVYSKKMPDIEHLMQVWPAEMEAFLQEQQLPDLSAVDVDLPSLVRIIAAVLDIPVYSQLTETLHVVFTLYSEFKTNQHFAAAGENEGAGDPRREERERK